MRILFSSTAGAGHVGPLLPLARAARRAGHDVLVATPPAAERHVQRVELPWHPLDAATPEDLQRVSARLAALSGTERLVAGVVELFGRAHSGAALGGMLDLVAGWRPDVMVGESCELASVVAAERHGVPMVRAAIGLGTGFEDGLPFMVAEVLDELRARAGVDADPAGDNLASAPRITRAPRGLTGGDDRPGLLRVRYPSGGGDVLDRDLGWDPGDERRLVYVSLGTEIPSPRNAYFPRLYRQIADALASVDARVLIAIGDQREPEELGPMPASVRVVQWVPQAALFPHVAATVGHGGAGSTVDALAAGVPMALIPLFADQPINARLVADAGAGVSLVEDDVREVGRVVRALLEDRSYGEAAKRIAGEIRALPPIEAAVALLEEAARPSSSPPPSSWTTTSSSSSSSSSRT